MIRIRINAQYPQPRQLRQAAEILRQGGVGVFPTDNTYAFGCDLLSRKAAERIRQIKGIDPKHPMSFVCADLSQAAHYAVIENRNYRVLRHHLPGKYTFVLPATREVPRIAQSKVRSVGIRIPECLVAVALVQSLGNPVISTTVPALGDATYRYVDDPDEIVQMYGRSIDFLLDAGEMVGEPSSVVDLSSADPVILRDGSGDVEAFR